MSTATLPSASDAILLLLISLRTPACRLLL
jgi:hypothetical protein